MPQSDPLQILLAHDRWATAQVISTCRQLPPEKLHAPFDIGPGSLHNTLAHIIAVVRALTDTLAGQPSRPRLDDPGQAWTLDQLQAYLDESYPQLVAEASRGPLSDLVTRTAKSGKVITLTRGAVFVHVTTHAMHHRAQCLNMLRQLSLAPLPPVSVAEWTLFEGTCA